MALSSLEISEGMFGLLGPNGAGKSSFVRTQATLQEAGPGSGQSTLPLLFVGNEFIGGYSEFETLIKNGEFEQLLDKNR